MAWLDGWERIEIANRPGGSYTGDEPWRCVLHSTEGLSVASAVGAYTTAGVPPTVTIGLAEGRKVQHIDTDRSAYAVMNQPGGVETNRWRAIQAEIVMFADQTKAQQYGGLYVGDLTDAHYAFLRECLLELQADKPFGFDGPDFIRYPDSYGNTRYRMSFAEWEQFGGTCGHMHVPENDHGDPGELSRTRLFQGDDVPLSFDDEVVKAIMANFTFIRGLDPDAQLGDSSIKTILKRLDAIEAKLGAGGGAGDVPVTGTLHLG